MKKWSFRVLIIPAIDFTITIKLEGNTITNCNNNFFYKTIENGPKSVKFAGFNIWKTIWTRNCSIQSKQMVAKMITFCTYQIPLNIFLVDWCPYSPIKCGVQQHHIKWWEALYSYYSNLQCPITPWIRVVWITWQIHWGTCMFPWAPSSAIRGTSCSQPSHHQ